MGQDQLFKTILERLLQEFLELFFPETAARLDFATLRFVDKEIFANVPAGAVREADVVARLETREGVPEIVTVHVEIQSEHESDFPRRMFEYYSVLRLHYGFLVFPVVLYLRRGPSSKLAEYREALFGQELLLFRYHSVALARLPAEEYVETSPLGAALSALMSREKTRDRVRLRLSMLERVVGSKLDQAVKYLLVNVIETFRAFGRRRRTVPASQSRERSTERCKRLSLPGPIGSWRRVEQRAERRESSRVCGEAS